MLSKAVTYQETQKVSQFMRELERNTIKLISAFRIHVYSNSYSQKHASFETLTENHRNPYETSLS